MAFTYGSNLGSSTAGGFGIYSMTTGGADTVTVFKANVVTGAVTITAPLTNPVPLTALQQAALSTLFAKLITVGTVAGNELAYIRKLVGVVSLTSGVKVALAAVNLGPNEFGLNVNLDGAGTALLYVPNSASAGLFTGFGADPDSTVIPPIPTTQRYDAIANIPGVYLPGAVAMAVSVPQAAPTVTLSVPTLASGYAENGATLQRDFIVEKINRSLPDPGPGAGTLLFNIRFAAGGAAGNQSATMQNIAGDLTVPGGWLYRVVNPAGGDATLADIAITVGGTIPL